MPAPRVVALVLNWNLPDDTLRCVQSLRRSDYPNLHIVVVDNGSRPEVFARIRSELPDIDVIRSEVNLGFAEGNNLGLRHALGCGADYVLVINNDTIVDPHMIARLVGVAEQHPDAGLIGPVIYYLDRPQEVWFAGYRFAHGIYMLRRGLHLEPPIRPVEEVDFVSGCGVLIRPSLLKTVGLFSNEYFMYYEDLDLCFRAKTAGWRILCVTDATMWHAVSSSTGGPDSPAKQYYQVRSSLVFYRKHSRGVKRLLNVLLRLGHALYSLSSAVLRGRLKLDAVAMFIKGLLDGWRQPTRSTPAPQLDPLAVIPVDACPICGAPEREVLFEGSDRLHGLPGRFPVVHCTSCGSRYLAQRPVEPDAYYPPDSYAAYDGVAGHHSRATGRSYGLWQRQKLMEALKPAGGMLLDVGCGAGDFLAQMNNLLGWQVAGLEPSAEASRYACEVRGLNVRRGVLPCSDLADRAYDAITLWHVLEHVPNPVDVLADVRRLLKPDGVLVVSVPAADSWEAMWFGEDWAGYDVPRHLVTFTRSSLEQFGHRAGFRTEERRGIVQGFASLRLSLSIRLERKGGLWRRWRGVLVPMLLPALFVYMRLRSGGRLGVAVFVARPDDAGPVETCAESGLKLTRE